jgi:SAM-dependent methyltransferase
MLHHNNCPLCSSNNITIYLKCTDHFVSKEEFPIFRCSECSFIFTQDYPEETDIGRYYESDDYISHSNTKRGFVNNVYQIARTYMLSRKKRIINSVTGLNSGKLLDIGSGTGHFAFTMKKAGWDVKGIEINEKARSIAISEFDLEIFSPEQISKFENNSFDCITLWHVLEHFHDPSYYLTKINQILKPNGACLIALPNCESFDSKHYGHLWAAFDVPRHLWHFSPATLKLFADNHGFILKKYSPLPLDVFYISILSEKYSGSKLPVLKGIAKSFFFALRSFFNRKRSSSVLYLLKKKADQ